MRVGGWKPDHFSENPLTPAQHPRIDGFLNQRNRVFRIGF